MREIGYYIFIIKFRFKSCSILLYIFYFVVRRYIQDNIKYFLLFSADKFRFRDKTLLRFRFR